jgi:hypothetical protein
MPITSPTPIPAGPAVPDSTAAEGTFDTSFEAFLDWQKTQLQPGVNALAENVYANAGEAATSAATAAAQAATATAAASAAASATNFKGNWSAQTGAAAVPYSVAHLGAVWLLLSNIADVTAKVPGTAPEWQRVGAPAWVRKTSAYAAVSGDRIKASTPGGAWSLTFPPAPLDGDPVEVQDVDGTFATNALTLLANGKKIMGFTTSLVLDKANTHLVFVYDATNGDWRY